MTPARTLLRRLARRLPEGVVRLDDAALGEHAGDKWFARSLPEAVALPESPGQVATLLAFAHRHRIPDRRVGAADGDVDTPAAHWFGRRYATPPTAGSPSTAPW